MSHTPWKCLLHQYSAECISNKTTTNFLPFSAFSPLKSRIIMWCKSSLNFTLYNNVDYSYRGFSVASRLVNGSMSLNVDPNCTREQERIRVYIITTVILTHGVNFMGWFNICWTQYIKGTLCSFREYILIRRERCLFVPKQSLLIVVTE